TSAGLQFEAGKVIVFQFQTKYQPYSVFDQSNLVLREAAEQVHRLRRRVELNGTAAVALGVKRDQSITKSPNDILPSQYGVMLKVEVEGIDFRSESDEATVKAVVIDLESHIR